MPTLPTLNELLAQPWPVLLAITIALLLSVRFVRLNVLVGAPAGDGRTQSRRWTWPRLWLSKSERLAAEAALIRADTEILLSRLDHARATGGLAQAKVELEAILASAIATTRPATNTPVEPSLTRRDLEQVLTLVSEDELGPKARATLSTLLAATLAEKSTRHGNGGRS